MKRIIGLLVVLSLYGSELIGQRYFIRNFSAKNGLSQSEIGDIVQDKSGRLVLTTAASGIDIFDGISFSQLTEEDGLVSSFISKVFRDSQNNTWLISSKGLNQLGSDSIISYPLDQVQYPIESVFGVEEIGEEIFLISCDQGLLEFNKGQYSFYTSKNYPNLRCFDIIKTSFNTVLVATDQGLFEFINNELIRSDIGDGLKEKVLLALIENANGEICIGTERGFYRCKNNTYQFEELFADDSYSVISFLNSRSGALYVGTNGKGLYIRNQNEDNFARLHEGNGLSDDFTWSIYEDDDENIWVGTSGAGLDLIAANHFQIYTPSDGLANDIVYDILERENGEIWMGIIQGGISVFGKEETKNYGIADGLSHSSVRCLHDEGDTLWIGTENGLTIYFNGQFKDVSEDFGLQGYAIFDIHRDQSGALWFACKGERYYGENGGVVRYDRGTRSRYNTDEGMTSDNVYCIFEKDNGEILFGTTAGITIWDGEQMQAYQGAGDSPCYGTVLSMRSDWKGNIWIGTVNGLGLIKPNAFECLKDKPGLAAKTIYLLENQGDSILWIGSSSGIEKMDLNYFYKTDSIKSVLYNDYSGFYGTECNQNAVTKDREGNYWFGTIRGAVKYIPSNDNSKALVPRIEVSRIGLGGKNTDWKDMGYPLDQKGLPKNLQLQHNDNSIQLEFLSVSLVDPEAQMYSFYLEGAEDDWSDFKHDRSVFYSNLQPGDYVFKVRAKNINSGLLSEASSFRFSILPAVWQTWWFKAICFLCLAAAITGFVLWRIRSIRLHEKEQRDFQQRVSELEMTALRSQMNPHFLFNSLNSVNHFIIKNQKKEASEYLTKFSRLVRIVLHNSKEKLVSLEEELNAFKLYLDLESLRFADQFEFEQSIDPQIDTSQIKIPPLLLQPYAENAIWHGILHLTERTGKLRLAISPNEKGVEIIIEDNGVGRAKAELMKSKSAIQKKSMGMKINADRMKLSGGLYNLDFTVEIEDLFTPKGEAQGTRVIINIVNHV